jgi:hypothetical protein
MKIQLTKNGKSNIEGFHTIMYDDPSKINELTGIVNNSCEYILANTILDDFEITESPKIVALLVSKLRLGGSLVLVGHDMQMLAKSLIDNFIGVGEISDLIKDKRSISTALNTIAIAEENGLKISTVKFNNYMYEIVCVRE